MTEHRQTHSQEKGFTLAELMIALLVFSFVASIGVFSLRLGAEARDQLQEADAGIRDLDLMRVMMKNDLLQIVERPVRDEFGAATTQSFFGAAAHPQSAVTSGERLLISFVRDGWINPEAAEPRSSLQYVEYLERENQLIRRVRPYLDDARNQPVSERVLLGGLTAEIDIEFLRGEVSGRFDWVEDWPSGGVAEQTPRVMAITLTNQRYGALRCLFWVSSAGGEQQT